MSSAEATQPPEILGLLGDPMRWRLVIELGRSDRRVGELVHPNAVRVMAERDIDISGRPSKPLSRFARTQFDRIITLCDKRFARSARSSLGCRSPRTGASPTPPPQAPTTRRRPATERHARRAARFGA
jgi:hypothetical protein